MLPQKETQGGFSLTAPKVTTVNHYLLIYGGARACAGFTQNRIWKGDTGIGRERVEAARNAWGGGFKLLQQVVVSHLG